MSTDLQVQRGKIWWTETGFCLYNTIYFYLPTAFQAFPFLWDWMGFIWPDLNPTIWPRCVCTDPHKQAASALYLFASRDLKGVFTFIRVPHFIWYWPRHLWENELPLCLWESPNPRFALEDYWVLRKALTCTFLVRASCIWVHNMQRSLWSLGLIIGIPCTQTPAIATLLKTP